MRNTLKLEKVELKIADVIISAGPIELSFECNSQEYAEVIKSIMESIQSDIQNIEFSKILGIMN